MSSHNIHDRHARGPSNNDLEVLADDAVDSAVYKEVTDDENDDQNEVEGIDGVDTYVGKPNKNHGTTTTVTLMSYVTDVPPGYSGPLVTDGLLTAAPTPTPTPAPSASFPPSMVPQQVSTLQDLDATLAVAVTTTVPTTTPHSTPTTAAAAAVGTGASGASQDTDSGNGDANTAVKAGVTIGVLAGILLIGMAIFWLVGRRKRQMEARQAADDDAEKHEGPAANPFAEPVAVRPSSPNAPRLSLRSLSQFGPNMAGQQYPDRRASRGAVLALGGPPSADLNKPLPGPSMWERPLSDSSDPFDHDAPANPFGNDAAPANPFGDHAERLPDHTSNPVRSSTVGVATTADVPSPMHSPVEAGAGAGAGLGDGLVRKASLRKDNTQKRLDLTRPAGLPSVPASPGPSEYSMDLASPNPAAAPPTGQFDTSVVHRVQMNFMPSLDDELPLKAGELIRLVHEYDDGWVRD